MNMKPVKENTNIVIEPENNFVQVLLLEPDDASRVYVAQPDKRLRAIGKVLAVGPGRQLFNGTWTKLNVKPGDFIAFNSRLLDEIYLNKGGTERLFVIEGQEIHGKLTDVIIK